MMEKPILFNTEMVQAILEGRKTQTRRPIKQPFEIHEYGNTIFVTHPKDFKDEYCRFHPYEPPCHVGDTLWVRETWQLLPSRFDEIPPEYNYIYAASHELSEECTGWRPSIHMPKKAARIFLKVTNVRVERLHDITEDGARAEGIRSWTKDGQVYKYSHADEFNWRDAPKTAKEAFEKLWNSCYDFPKSWLGNPWVWVIEFERLEG